MSRARRSLPPPGGNGTIMRTGLVGYTGCACASTGMTQSTRTHSIANRERFITSPFPESRLRHRARQGKIAQERGERAHRCRAVERGYGAHDFALVRFAHEPARELRELALHVGASDRTIGRAARLDYGARELGAVAQSDAYAPAHLSREQRF